MNKTGKSFLLRKWTVSLKNDRDGDDVSVKSHETEICSSSD